MRQINLRRTIIFFGGWILIAFIFSGMLYFSNTQINPDRALGWKDIILWQVIILAWATIFPLIALFAKRFRFERHNWWKILPVHLLASMVFLFLHAFIYVLVHWLIDPETFDPELSFLGTVVFLVVRNWVLNTTTYSLIVWQMTMTR